MSREKKPENLMLMKNEEEDEEQPPQLEAFHTNVYPERPTTNKRRNNTQTVMMHPMKRPRNCPMELQKHGVIEKYNEEMTIRFLFGNGLQLTSVDDPNFRQFFHLLNPGKSLPEYQNMISKTLATARPTLPYNRAYGPMTVTVEAVRKNDEVFLTLSTHFFDIHGTRQNLVHFEKVIAADYNGIVLAARLRRVVDPRMSQIPGPMNILSPNIKLVQQVTESSSSVIRNKFICAFNFISGIARETLNIEEFAESLVILRNFVEAIRTHREVYTKFKRMQIDAGTCLDLPQLDIPTDWLSTLQFISSCSILHSTFANIQERWCIPEYLQPIQENALANIYDFLMVLCNVATQLCSADSCLSQVLHSMSIVNNSIENCGIREARRKMRLVFSKYYRCISTGRIGTFYSIASLLDPRYGYSESIFSTADWKTVEIKCVAECRVVHSIDKLQKRRPLTIGGELDKYKRLIIQNRPDLGETTPFKWWQEMADELPTLFKRWLEYSCVPAVSVDGKRFFAKGGKFSHMFATIEEERHQKALILAQSSQEFVGRGAECINIYEKLKNVETNFQQLEFEEEFDEDDEGPDVLERETPIVDKFFKSADQKVEKAGNSGCLEPKQEILEEEEEVNIKIEEPE